MQLVLNLLFFFKDDDDLTQIDELDEWLQVLYLLLTFALHL